MRGQIGRLRGTRVECKMGWDGILGLTTTFGTEGEGQRQDNWRGGIRICRLGSGPVVRSETRGRPPAEKGERRSAKRRAEGGNLRKAAFGVGGGQTKRIYKVL